jgi:hypothetical protein
MAAVLFRCPVSGKNIDAHLEMDENSLRGLNTPILVRCPQCGKDHFFQMHEAKLRDKKLSA